MAVKIVMWSDIGRIISLQAVDLPFSRYPYPLCCHCMFFNVYVMIMNAEEGTKRKAWTGLGYIISGHGGRGGERTEENA